MRSRHAGINGINLGWDGLLALGPVLLPVGGNHALKDPHVASTSTCVSAMNSSSRLFCFSVSRSAPVCSVRHALSSGFPARSRFPHVACWMCLRQLNDTPSARRTTWNGSMNGTASASSSAAALLSIRGFEHHHWRSLARTVVLKRTIIRWCSKPRILTTALPEKHTPSSGQC